MAPGSQAREPKQSNQRGPAAVAGKPSPRPELPVAANPYEPLSTESSSADEDGVLQTYKERQEYVKPSEKRRKAKAAGRKRWLKTVEKKNLDQRQY